MKPDHLAEVHDMLDRAETTEDGVALEFARVHHRDLRWVQEWHRWLRWDGMRWENDRTVVVIDLVRKHCRNFATDGDKARKTLRQAAFIAAVERLARSDRRHAITPDDLDQGDLLLNTPSGIVDLRTGVVSSHDSGKLLTKITTAPVGGGCSTWRSFLDRITGGDVDLQKFLQRVVGYCLTASTREHALFFLYGTGANGKSTFVDTLVHVLGDYASVAAMATFEASTSEKHPTDLAGLRGARLVAASETEQGRHWDETRIKSITGGDPITARFMRQDFFTFTPHFKLLLAGNHKPQLRVVDEAFRRRLHLIPFTEFIPAEERDHELPAKLKAEAGGILAWAIEGCLEWQRMGLVPPSIVVNATADYMAAQDSFSAWLDECCDVRENAWEPPGMLFESWRKWTAKAGEPAGTSRAFGDRLEAAGFLRARTHGQRQHRGLCLRSGQE